MITQGVNCCLHNNVTVAWFIRQTNKIIIIRTDRSGLNTYGNNHLQWSMPQDRKPVKRRTSGGGLDVAGMAQVHFCLLSIFIIPLWKHVLCIWSLLTTVLRSSEQPQCSSNIEPTQIVMSKVMARTSYLTCMYFGSKSTQSGQSLEFEPSTVALCYPVSFEDVIRRQTLFGWSNAQSTPLVTTVKLQWPELTNCRPDQFGDNGCKLASSCSCKEFHWCGLALIASSNTCK